MWEVWDFQNYVEITFPNIFVWVFIGFELDFSQYFLIWKVSRFWAFFHSVQRHQKSIWAHYDDYISAKSELIRWSSYLLGFEKNAIRSKFEPTMITVFQLNQSLSDGAHIYWALKTAPLEVKFEPNTWWYDKNAQHNGLDSIISSPMFFLVGGHLWPFLNLINRIILSHLISKGYTCCFSAGPRPAKLCFRCENLGIENQRHSLDLCPQNCASFGELCKNVGHRKLAALIRNLSKFQLRSSVGNLFSTFGTFGSFFGVFHKMTYSGWEC